MKKALLLFLLVSALVPAFAQTMNDSILIEKRLFGKHYIWKGIPINQTSQMEEILSKDPETSHEFKFSNAESIISSVFAYAGGFFIGYEIGAAIQGKVIENHELLWIGGGSIGLSLLFGYLSSNHLDNAVNIYNTNLSKSKAGDVSLNFGLTSDGVGLTLSF